MTRRPLAYFASAVTLILVFALVVWWSRGSHACRDLGNASDYAMPSVSRIECFPAYVVAAPGLLRVLLAESPHLAGETLTWDDQRQVFRSRAHGETFDLTWGTRQRPCISRYVDMPYRGRGRPPDGRLILGCKRRRPDRCVQGGWIQSKPLGTDRQLFSDYGDNRWNACAGSVSSYSARTGRQRRWRSPAPID